MPLVRKKSVVAINSPEDSNIIEENNDAPVINDAAQEEEENKEIEESNKAVSITNTSNDVDVTSSREKYQASNLNNKNIHIYLKIERNASIIRHA